MRRWIVAPIIFAVLAFTLTLVPAVPPTEPQDTKGKPPAPEATQAAGRATVSGGLKATVWAAEPLSVNPVAFCFDGQGRAYVAETNRFKTGVPDTRDHMAWLEEDIACRTVADRVKMYEKHGYGAKNGLFEKYDDQIRMVWDSTGKGVADKSTIYASGFNKLKDGLGAGVLAHKGSVYYTNIPDLYRFKDTKGTGVADVKESLATGFGIHVQFLGHDMHGLRMGPDGRLYFSIGDRGFNVTTKEGKHLMNPDSGAVLRCNLDGSNLEVVHIGLRNPQELAFDDFGNLFTYDNNCDSGDKARWVYLVEGGDSGWRCGYQYGDKGGVYHTPAVPQGNRGPWNTEKIWHTQHDGQPAYIVPPLAHFGAGPSGITHYPGIGLNDKYKDHFFCCDFSSSPSSKIWAVSVKPKGASFELSKPEPFVQNMVPTDCEFGPDGAFYWSDWTGGWSPPNKGRIFRVEDPEAMKNPAVGEAKKLFAEGFEKKTVEELVKLLGHPHQQVRLEAQWEMANQTLDQAFAKALAGSKNQLARIHAIWGLGMCERVNKKSAIDEFAMYATDKDPVIRTQIARVLSWRSSIPFKYRQLITNLVADDDLHVKMFALVAYGKLDAEPVQNRPVTEQLKYAPIFDLLKKNADKDVYLRQAAVQCLVTMAQNPVDLFNAWQQAKDIYDTPSVRMGVVLALRRMQSAKLTEFLADSDPKIVAEAARAIYDLEMMGPMVELAKLADKPGLPEAVAFRAVAANFKLGGPEHAVRVANVAARTSESDSLRAGAMRMLGQWAKPTRLDIITGLTQNLGERPAENATKAMLPVLAKLFVGSDVVRKEAVTATTKLGMKDVAPLMLEIVKDAKQTDAVRADALYALDSLKAPQLKDALVVAQSSPPNRLRAAGIVLKSKLDPKGMFKELQANVELDTTPLLDRQATFAAIAAYPESKEMDDVLIAALDQLAAGKLNADVQLDCLEAAKARSTAKIKVNAEIKNKLAAIEKKATAAEAQDPLAKYRETLSGGDAAKGRDVFLNNSSVYCQRCHKLDGQGGEVGPSLNGIAKDKTRDYLLESIVAPSKQIAKGFESVILNTIDGKVISGVLRAKDAKGYTVVLADGKVVIVPKDDVESEKPDKSAMPDDLIKKISKKDLRDLVEFLSELKEVPKQ